MPLIFRSMKADGDRPRIGNDANSLGIRIGDNEGDPFDIPVQDSQVRPETGGMSVAPSPASLPRHKIPREFAKVYPGARCKQPLICWQMGEGPFETGPLTERLVFRNDPGSPTEHGFVEPHQEMLLTEYQDALTATQPAWKCVPWVQEAASETEKSS